LTPESEPDPSIFSTEWNREGIQVGTAIGLLVRKQESQGTPSIDFQHFWGKTKREDLVRSLSRPTYRHLTPSLEIGLSFLPATTSLNYSTWPILPALLPVAFPGVKTSRDKLL